MKTVIIGNGIAGNEVAWNLRQQDPYMEITMISAERFPEYDPCSLPYFVGREVQRDSVFRRTLEDYEAGNIELALGNKAISIDPDKKEVETVKGDTFSYDKLVLAHGGHLIIPPIPGIDKDGVFSCKLLGEADKLDRHKGSKAVCIGSGAIGIEVAEALKRKGYAEVTIIELLPWIMPTLFCEPAARRLENALLGYGIGVITGEKVLSLGGNDKVSFVATDRRTIECDTVVVATGVVPGRDLAETAGIETRRGIIVNERLETSVADIYACGDVVETFDACSGEGCMYQLKHNAIDQARIVASNIRGEDAVYHGAYPFARAHFFETHAASFGKTMKNAERTCHLEEIDVIERFDDGNYLRLLMRNGKIIGGQAIGTYVNYIGLFMGLMWRKDDVRELMAKWSEISGLISRYPWQYRKIGSLIGLGTTDASV